MRFLLDSSLLIALAHEDHTGYRLASDWFNAHRDAQFFVSSIVETAFLRNSVQAKLQPSVASARQLLEALRDAIQWENLPDTFTARQLPDYVKKPSEVTDGHLLALAHQNGLHLATLDTGIPGAHLVK